MADGKRKPGRPPGALYQHAVRTYGAANAQAVRAADAPADLRELLAGRAGRVFVGSLSTVMEGLGLSNYYHHTVRDALVRMGCLLQVRRGTHHRPSVWLLLTPPTEQRYRALGKPLESRTAEHMTRHDEVIGRWLRVAGRTHPALLQAAMDTGNETIGELLDWLARLPELQRRTLPPCFGFRGAETHTCLVPSLDVLADRSAGADKRRRDHLAALVE
jgi:hypothetical protein